MWAEDPASWQHTVGMGVLVQIRDVPEVVHRTLKARAATKGTSLSAYLRAELELIALRPTPAELRERLKGRTRVEAAAGAAAEVRALRDEIG